jgi:hypothetical protein
MNREKRALILGMIFGDAYVNPKGTIQIEHSQKQEDYVLWKNELLDYIFNNQKGRCKPYYRERLDQRTGKVYKQVRCYRQHKYLKQIRRWLYTPEKTFTRRFLDYLTPQAIAIWYMDDGNLRGYTSKKTGKVASIQVSLYTHCPLKEAEVVRDYFKERWNVEFKLYRHKDLYYLCANTENGNRFLDIVREFVIPSMRYKVDLIPTSARPRQFKSSGEDIV